MEILEVLINDHGVSSRSSSYGAGAQHLPLKERQRSSSPSQSSVTSTSETPLATSTPPRPSPSPSPSLSALTPSRPSRSTRRLSQAAPAHPPQPVPVKALISTVPFPCSSPASSADEYVFGGLDDGHYALHERYDDVFCDPQGSTRGPKESTPVRPSCVPAWARSDGMHGYSDRDSDSDSNSDSDSDSAHTCSSGSISRPPTAFEAPRPESATTAGSDVEMDGKDTWRAWLDWTAEPRSAPAGLQE